MKKNKIFMLTIFLLYNLTFCVYAIEYTLESRLKENILTSDYPFTLYIILGVFIAILALEVMRFIRGSKKEPLTNKKGWVSVLFTNINEIVFVVDKKGLINFVNDVTKESFEIVYDDIKGRKIEELIKIVNSLEEKIEFSISELINEKVEQGFKGYIQVVDSDKRILVHGSIFPIYNKKSKFDGSIIILKDMTEYKNREDKIHEMAYYDEITGMPNKLFFSEVLKTAVENIKQDNKLVAIMLVDIDNFMTINDSLGHSYGDRFLKTIGKCIKDVLRDGDFISRIGGDEFGIVLPNINKLNDITGITDRIMGVFKQPWIIEDQEFYITASIGIAVCPFDGKEYETLIKNSDTAMNKAKELGKNNYKFFTKSMNDSILERLEAEKSLRYAISNHEFEVYYQPQIDIKTMKISGAEALVRWIDPVKGVISPIQFIPLAEETGLINELGQWVLETACRQAKEWSDNGYPDISIAVNLSTKQLLQCNLASIIQKVLDDIGLDPKRLELEITESIAMQNIDTAMYILKDLKKMGVKIALDDFGTGYSSLNYLKMLTIDYLKIDKSFIRDIKDNQAQEEIAKALVVLAHGVKLEVIAEGVETVEQLEFLKEHHCDKFQGYLFSPPVPANKFEKLFSKEIMYKL